jgi:hypothetical protein
MMRRAAALLLALLCGGCFGSDASVYDGVRPLQPFHAGQVTTRDKDGKMSRLTLAQDPGGFYRLTGSERGKDFGKGYRLRFFGLDGTGLLVAEVKECNDGFKACAASTGWLYELVRVTPGGAEWRDPDCSKSFSKLSGVTVKIDSCSFSDRASLEKALRAAASMPWKADGAYLLH